MFPKQYGEFHLILHKQDYNRINVFYSNDYFEAILVQGNDKKLYITYNNKREKKGTTKKFSSIEESKKDLYQWMDRQKLRSSV